MMLKFLFHFRDGKNIALHFDELIDGEGIKFFHKME